MAIDVGTISDKLKALTEGDSGLFDEVYAPDAIVWHNTDGVELTRDQVLHMARAIGGAAKCRVDVKQCFPTSDGFVQTQSSTFSLRDGRDVVFDSALVIALDDGGRIQRMDEYLDGAALIPLIEASGL